jgi:glycosyltransferase involved in cell wall biosynthesis
MISLYETFGKVCLEAADARSNVLVSRNLPISEFMGNRVYYCDPKNTKSIREVVQVALSAPRNDDLHRYVISNFSRESRAKLYLDKFIELKNKGK